MSRYRNASLYFLLNDTLGQEAAMQLHWQYRCRTQPRVMEKVLAEVKVMAVEGKIRTSPAQAATDLIKRWNTRQTEDVVGESL